MQNNDNDEEVGGGGRPVYAHVCTRTWQTNRQKEFSFKYHFKAQDFSWPFTKYNYI
jgi:hypothetical protein